MSELDLNKLLKHLGVDEESSNDDDDEESSDDDDDDEEDESSDDDDKFDVPSEDVKPNELSSEDIKSDQQLYNHKTIDNIIKFLNNKQIPPSEEQIKLNKLVNKLDTLPSSTSNLSPPTNQISNSSTSQSNPVINISLQEFTVKMSNSDITNDELIDITNFLVAFNARISTDKKLFDRYISIFLAKHNIFNTSKCENDLLSEITTHAVNIVNKNIKLVMDKVNTNINQFNTHAQKFNKNKVITNNNNEDDVDTVLKLINNNNNNNNN